MLKLFRGAGSLAMLIGLSGCNLVVSEDPWFTEADTVGVPVTRDGLWLSVSGADCRVDTDKPAEQWPECAAASYVRGNQTFGMAWEVSGDGRRRRRAFAGWESIPTLTANGDPLIVQIHGEPPEKSEDASESEEPARQYWYIAVRPTRFDEEGRMMASEQWPVKCGPEREPQKANADRRNAREDEDAAITEYATDRPFPGLTVIGENCVAESVDALRHAARLSEALGDKSSARWVRDGWR